MCGQPRLLADLRDLGYQVQEVHAPNGQQFAVIAGFVVPGGNFVDRVVDLGLQGTADFPQTVASAIHVRADPQLYDYRDTVPGVRNITNSALGPEWRYWSHNFGWKGERSARRLMSQVNGIFLRAA